MNIKDTIKLLRIPFSFFLMPVFLFALSQSVNPNWLNASICFIIIHLLIYPASNAYNSYMDQDEGSIGGLKHPPKADKTLFYLTIVMDITGVLCALFISRYFATGILLYIIASRAYSYRAIRLKQYPIIGYLTVVFFQGGFTFWICINAMGDSTTPVLAMAASSFLIAGVYPLTQIYQHEADAKDGVNTISMKVGYIGTFILTAVMFTIAMVLLFAYFNQTNQLFHFWILQLFMIPVVVYFISWFIKTMKDKMAANFEYTMRMNLLASACMNSCFIVLIILNHFA